MRTQAQDAGSAKVELRLDRFREHAKRRGLHNALARAKFIGVHHATVGRIENGDRCGERFIAQVLAAFPELKFEDLFKVVIVDEPSLERAS
jgi:DNA-binding XRE family transcriptional regulator